MAVGDLLTIRISNHEAQFLFQGLRRYESAQLSSSEKLPPVERSEVSICANFQTALELIKKSASLDRTLGEIVATVAANGLTTSFRGRSEVHMRTSAHVNRESPFADSASEGLFSGASRKIVQSKSGNLTTGGTVNPPLLWREAIPVAAIDCFATPLLSTFAKPSASPGRPARTHQLWFFNAREDGKAISVSFRNLPSDHPRRACLSQRLVPKRRSDELNH